LIVVSVDFEDDLYGVLVSVKKGRKKYAYPLCDLEAVDKSTSNSKLLDDYGLWFANCR